MTEIRLGDGPTVQYELMGNTLSFNDGELMINLAKREKDFPHQIDICEDEYGDLCMGLARKYVAQVDIPARRYEYIANGQGEDGEPIMEKVALPFDPQLVTITLWDLEE